MPTLGALHHPAASRMASLAGWNRAGIRALVRDVRDVSAFCGLRAAFREVVALVFAQVLWALGRGFGPRHDDAIQHRRIRFHVGRVGGADDGSSVGHHVHRPTGAVCCPTCRGRSDSVRSQLRPMVQKRLYYRHFASARRSRAADHRPSVARPRGSEKHPAQSILGSAYGRCCLSQRWRGRLSIGNRCVRRTEFR